MRNNMQIQPLDRSLSIVLAICCLVSISADQLIVGVDGKKDKDKGKGGNMVIMMGGGYGGGGKGGGYGRGGGGGGGGFPMPIPMPMPMFCPPNFGRSSGGSRKGGGRGGGVKEKIMIIPIPTQMLAGGEKGSGHAGFAEDGAGSYGGASHESSGTGFSGEASTSSDFGGGGGSYDAVAEMPAIMMPIGGDYGGATSRGFGGGARSGDSGGYGAASHAYSIELAPINGIINSAGGMDSMDYPFDQYASASRRQVAIREPSSGGFGTTESSYSKSDNLAVGSGEQFDLQASASGEDNPPSLDNTQPSTRNSYTSSNTKSVPLSEKQRPHRSRK